MANEVHVYIFSAGGHSLSGGPMPTATRSGLRRETVTPTSTITFEETTIAADGAIQYCLVHRTGAGVRYGFGPPGSAPSDVNLIVDTPSTPAWPEILIEDGDVVYVKLDG